MRRALLVFTFHLASVSSLVFAQANIYLCDDGHGGKTYQNTGPSHGCTKVEVGPDPDKWALISKLRDIDVYADRSTFLITPTQRKAWVMTNYMSPQKSYGKEFSSVKELTIFRCQAGQTAMRQQILYSGLNGTGTPVDSITLDEGKEKFSEPVPETIGEFTLKGICKLAKK